MADGPEEARPAFYGEARLLRSTPRAYLGSMAENTPSHQLPEGVPSNPPSLAPFSDPVGMQEMLAAIVESSDDAIISKDLNGTIMSWNKGAERVFGYAAEEAIGRPITMLLPPDRFQEEATILATLVRDERIHHFETERLTKDGRRIHVSLSVSPIKNRTGRVIGGAKIARDISLRRQLEREREQALAQERNARTLAEAANRAKDAFLAMVSHELRSPLSPILSWSRMLRMKALDEAQSARALETIERSARAQAQLIDDLLDISRIVTGKLRLEVAPVYLVSVIEQAVEVVRPAADAKQIRLHTVLDTETGAISGDPIRLQQVVWNLLSNAVKFTPKGGRVQITLERMNSHIEIAISDTGQGVSAEFLSHLFERFEQAETGPTRSHGGLGLGLAIVRHIVELHGGTVVAESGGEGKGATFTVKLPKTIFRRTAGESERRHPTLGPLPEAKGFPSLGGIRLLVVDDDPDSNEVVSTLLGAAGAEVRVAASAADALEQLKQWAPDVIVSDIGMPHEDGYMFLAKLHAQPGGTARIPAVALTAYATTDDRVRIFSAGFRAHVVKPIDPLELVVVVASVARAHGQT
jgi:PAS domain S-box-containing protein